MADNFTVQSRGAKGGGGEMINRNLVNKHNHQHFFFCQDDQLRFVEIFYRQTTQTNTNNGLE